MVNSKLKQVMEEEKLGLQSGMSGGLDLGTIDPRTLSQSPENKPYVLPPMSKDLQAFLGVTESKDPPVIAKGEPKEIADLKNLIHDVDVNGVGPSTDAFKGSILGDFRNPDIQSQYIERYKAYGQSTFDKLGFSPFRDNEALYNKETSWLSDIRRSASQWGTLTVLGFGDALGFGDLTDTKTAADYQKAMAIGSSSRGGIGGFTSNLLLNSGYTMGIMTELIGEEVLMALGEMALTAAAPATGGASLAGNAALATRMSLRATTAFNKISNAWQLGRKTIALLDNMRDISKFRQAVTNLGKGAANLANPLENTYDFFKSPDKLIGLSNLAKVYKGTGAMYRDIRAVRLAYGEGALEGGMVQSEIERDLIEKFRMENGRLPGVEESSRIREAALKAGATTSLTNIPVILFSNKLTMDGLLSGGVRRLGSDIITSTSGNRLLFKSGIKNPYSALSRNYFSRQLQLIKNPRALLSQSLRYTTANFAEGTQEIAQEVITGTNKDYWQAKYEGDPTRGGYMKYLADNLVKQVSGTGLETFASGFLMGGLISPISGAMGATLNGKQTYNNLKNRFLKRKEWKEAVAERDKELQSDIDILNELYADPLKYFSPDLEGLVELSEYQKVTEDARKKGDARTYYDMKDSSNAKYILTAIRYGRLDEYISQLEDMKSLNDTEIKEISGLEHGEYSKKLSETIDYAKNIKHLWQISEENFKNPFNPGNFKKGSVEYAEESMRYLSWQDAVEQLVFNQLSFRRALERQTNILAEARSIAGISNTPVSDLNVLFDHKNLLKEIALLDLEINGDPANDTVGLKESASKSLQIRNILEQKRRKLEHLVKFEAEVSRMKEEMTDDERISDSNFKSMKSTFSKYLKHITNQNNDFVSSSAAHNTLVSLLDYYILGERANNINSAINILTNPENFISTFERITDLKRKLHDGRKAEIKNSLEKFRDIKDDNDMLNDLMNIGVFFNPDDFEKLKKDKEVPPRARFYYTDTDNKSEIPVTTDDYKKAISIIRNRLGVLKNLPIEEASDEFDSWSRSKEPGDERTHEELASEFGFNSQVRSEVPLAEVLKKIIVSPHSSEREIALAEQLIKVAGRQVIVFTDLDQPSTYDSDDKKIHIDARYSSSDYKQGNAGSPLEHVILKEQIKKIAIENLESDKEFKKRILDLSIVTFEAFKKLKDADIKDDGLRTYFSKFLYGVNSEEDFVAEAMTNANFQNFLATINVPNVKNPVEKNSAWETFVKLVLDTVKKALGKDVSGTVLNAVLELTTAKINVQTVVKNQPSKVDSSIVSNKMPIENLIKDHPELAKKILEIFKEENARRKKDGTDLLLKDFDKMTDDEIYNSKAFSDYFAGSNWSKKERLIAEYNDERKKVEKIQLPKPAVASAPKAVSTPKAETPKIVNTQTPVAQPVAQPAAQPTTQIPGSEREKGIEKLRSIYGVQIQKDKDRYKVYSAGEVIAAVKSLEEAYSIIGEQIGVLYDSLLPEFIPLGDNIFIAGIKIPYYNAWGSEISEGVNTFDFLNIAGRMVTVVSIDGVGIPFYLTSGSDLESGWYPMFGFSESGWLNRTGKDDMHSFNQRFVGEYAASRFAAAAKALNEKYGTSVKSKDTEVIPLSILMRAINYTINVTPAENAAINPEADARTEQNRLRSNIRAIGSRLDLAKQDLNTSAEAEKTAIVPQTVSVPVQAQVEEKKEDSIIITREMRSALKNLGYSSADIDSMSVVMAADIVKNNISKPDKESRSQVKNENKADILKQNIFDILNSITNFEEWEKAGKSLQLKMAEDPDYRLLLNLDGEQIEKLLNDKLKEISISVKFDDLRIGEVVVLNDSNKSKVVIESKFTSDDMFVDKNKKNGRTSKMTVKDLTTGKVTTVTYTEDIILYRYNKDLDRVENMENQSVISEEEKQTAEQSMVTAEELNSSKTIQEDIAYIEKKSSEDLDNDLLNEICK